MDRLRKYMARNNGGAIIILIVFAIYCFRAPVANGSEMTNHLEPFSMQDQFKHGYSERSWNDAVLIFFVADREGSEFMGQWVDAIDSFMNQTVLGQEFSIIRVATLPRVPRLAIGMIRRMFSNEGDEWLLMDWEKYFQSKYQLAEKVSNILIFDGDRNLFFRDSLMEYTDALFSSISQQLAELFDE